ncbi:MAG TPA: hypothetical protein VLA16_06650 [Ideonella sp.]|nr:hypothetical protein [Ideonella sp.]
MTVKTLFLGLSLVLLLAIANGTVNVVDNNAPAGGRPAADAAKPGKPAAGRPAELSLREKYMEAVINQ